MNYQICESNKLLLSLFSYQKDNDDSDYNVVELSNHWRTNVAQKRYWNAYEKSMAAQ